MAQAYHAIPPTPIRAVRDEDAPIYDGQPIRRAHVTIITDDAVDDAAALGMAAMGMYGLLERLVGPDGSWTCSMGDLARRFACSERHVRDTAKTLEDAGLITRETVTGPKGMPIGVRWFLPRHRTTNPRTNYPEPTPEPTPELSCALDKVVVATVATRTEPNGSEGAPKPRKKRQTTPMPEDWSPEGRFTPLVAELGFSEATVARLADNFRDHWISKGETRADWDASFRTWLRNEVTFNGRRHQPKTNGLVF